MPSTPDAAVGHAAMHLPSLPSLDNLGTMGDHAASSAGLPPTPALQTPGSAPHAAAFHPGSSAPFPGAGPRLGTSATAPQHSSPAPAGSNLDRLLAGMPLKSSNSTGGLAEDEHGSGVPATPTRGVRVTAPTVSFGPTDLGSIGSLSSTPRHPLHGGGGVSGGGGLIAQALGGQRRESFTRLPAIGGGDSAIGDGAGAEGDDVSQGGRTTGMSIGSAAGTWAGGGNARGLVCSSLTGCTASSYVLHVLDGVDRTARTCTTAALPCTRVLDMNVSWFSWSVRHAAKVQAASKPARRPGFAASLCTSAQPLGASPMLCQALSKHLVRTWPGVMVNVLCSRAGAVCIPQPRRLRRPRSHPGRRLL